MSSEYTDLKSSQMTQLDEPSRMSAFVINDPPSQMTQIDEPSRMSAYVIDEPSRIWQANNDTNHDEDVKSIENLFSVNRHVKLSDYPQDFLPMQILNPIEIKVLSFLEKGEIVGLYFHNEFKLAYLWYVPCKDDLLIRGVLYWNTNCIKNVMPNCSLPVKTISDVFGCASNTIPNFHTFCHKHSATKCSISLVSKRSNIELNIVTPSPENKELWLRGIKLICSKLKSNKQYNQTEQLVRIEQKLDYLIKHLIKQ